MISIRPYTESMKLAANMLNYELILGRIVPTNAKTKFNFNTNAIKFVHNIKKHKVVANENLLVILFTATPL